MSDHAGQRVWWSFLPAIGFLLLLGGGGFWLVNDHGHHSQTLLREHWTPIHANNNVGVNLDNLRFVLLSAAFQDPIHHTIPELFEETITTVRENAREVLRSCTQPTDRVEAEQLLVQIDVIAERGRRLLAAPIKERWRLFTDLDVGAQPAISQAVRHMSVLHEAKVTTMYDTEAATRNSARRWSQVVVGITMAGLAVTLWTAWRLRRAWSDVSG